MTDTTTMERPEVEIASLVEVPPQDALAVFSAKREDGKPHPIDAILSRVRKEIDAFTPDMSTQSGRKSIASMAYRVSQAKSALKKVGDELAAEQKELPKRIDATRRHINETLDAWRDEIRQPLTSWEAKEESRIKGHEDALKWLNSMTLLGTTVDSTTLRQNLASVDVVVIGLMCEEYVEEYRHAKDAAIKSLTAGITERDKYEADQSELAKLRAEQAERARAEREEALRREGEERARLDAENDARAVAQAADLARRKAQDEAEAQILAAKRETEAAERRAAETEKRIRDEAAAKASAEAEEKARRETDFEHRRLINSGALAALVSGGIPVEIAKAVIKMIANDEVPNVSISY